MFGLVAVAERVGLKHAASVPEVLLAPATFEEELAAVGISTFPLAEVRAYQQRFMEQEILAGRAGNQAKWLSNLPIAYRSRFGDIPSDVEQTIGKARTVPETEVVIQSFFADPFVFAVRKKGRRRQEACIAYWNAPGFNPGHSIPGAA